jgi:hypothetical protein
MTTILRRFTGEWAALLQPETILTVCEEIGYTAWRDRLLTPVTTMQMDVLHCKTVPGVLKELTVFALVYNLVRMVMRQSATRQHTAVERISFLDALR